MKIVKQKQILTDAYIVIAEFQYEKNILYLATITKDIENFDFDISKFIHKYKNGVHGNEKLKRISTKFNLIHQTERYNEMIENLKHTTIKTTK